ncbi:MAG: AAA family ATPase [Gammaproteobacteria bacterium]|nr:AAA family ATPase [Gammaproteobacteria bacterium]
MYKKIYNLRRDPFSPTPDHQFCYWHDSYKRTLSSLRGIVYAQENAVMVIGQAGTGKTTLLNHLVGSLNPQQIKVANLTTATPHSGNIIHQVARGFCLNPSGLTKVALLNNLNKTLQQYKRTNTHALLVVDDAHTLTKNALQDIRRMASMYANQQALLHIFLFGSESLGDRVMAMGMEQANQRSLITLHLTSLNIADTRLYILHRLSKAGWDNNPQFAPTVFPLIHAVSRGIPRLINRVCARFLHYGNDNKIHELGEHDIRQVINLLHQEYLATKTHQPDKQYRNKATIHRDENEYIDENPPQHPPKTSML